MQIELNRTASARFCTCQRGFTGRQCEQTLVEPCDPNPCLPNGYCNAAIYSEASSTAYVCQCKPGYQGLTCEQNVNECLNATCHNGGLCIDGVNSYECECKWPWMGRYCETPITCSIADICKNNGKQQRNKKNLEFTLQIKIK